MSCEKCNCKCISCEHLEWKHYAEHDPCGKTDRGYVCIGCGKEMSEEDFRYLAAAYLTHSSAEKWRVNFAKKIMRTVNK